MSHCLIVFLRGVTMRTLVLGAQGQLGRDLCPRLSGTVIPLTRAEVDLTGTEALRRVLSDLYPQVVVNCAAYNLVDKAESEPEAAFATNAWAVRVIAQICADLGCRFVHFSTDYVFGLDAKRSAPYREEDAPGPISVYGLSKLSGEYLIRSTCPNHLIIRTCGLYGVWGTGGKGGNFVETMLRLAGQGKPLRVVADQRCTPSYTADVAEMAAKLIAGDATGLIHVTNAGNCSWHELAREIFSQSHLDVDLTPITSAEFNAPARRPPYSVLALDRLATLGLAPRPWREALAAYLGERTRKPSSS